MAINVSPYSIRADIKVPPKFYGPRSKYPFANMKVGDSFAVQDMKELNRVRVSASLYGREHRKKFAVRRTDRDDRDAKTYRCWRIA